MDAEEIQFAKDEIKKAIVDTAYGKGIPLPWSLLEGAIEMIEEQQKQIETHTKYIQRLSKALNNACANPTPARQIHKTDSMK